MSQTQTQPVISGKMFLFERPELLSKEQHGKFGFNRSEKPFEFCAKIRGVPITVGEISSAMKHYPIVFSADQNAMLIAVVGVIDDVNLFVDEKGNWDPETYIPGYIRRYPFALANESGGDRLAVVIDAGHQHMVEGGEMPLFQDGQPTEGTQAVIEFCKQYEADRQLSERVLKAIEPFGVVAGQTARYTPAGQTDQQAFAQYFGVDEAKLNQLPDDQFLELRRIGAIPLLHSQIISMTNWRSLMQRRAKRFNLTDATVARPVQLS